jgi:hypothetical protein
VRVSRATFLQACGLALIGARVDARTLMGTTAVACSNLADAGRPGGYGGRFRLQDATAPLFLQHLNTSFAVRSADGTCVRLVLAEVSERPVTNNVEQFSLIFHAPACAALRDGTHVFQHPVLGEFNLFIVPVGPPNLRRTVYQACFSRHLSPRHASDPIRRETNGSSPTPRETRGWDAVQSASSCWRT